MKELDWQSYFIELERACGLCIKAQIGYDTSGREIDWEAFGVLYGLVMAGLRLVGEEAPELPPCK